MANMLDYLDWRGDVRFSEKPLNEIDSLILSQLCYIDFKNIISSSLNKPIFLSSAAKSYFRKHRGEPAYLGAIVPSEIINLLAKAAKTERFREVRVCGYINTVSDDRQMQFSALTFLLDNGSSFVGYRGTDDTIIGWKENFNMSFKQPVPAQTEAVEYLEAVAAVRKEDLYVGGHSKGGNLAAYAVTKCEDETKKRIIEAYNHDGPGFNKAFIESPEYAAVKEKIRTIVPQTAIVGMLLEHEESYEVVKSNQKGIWQHDSFSWEVLGAAFIHLDSISKESKLIDSTLKKWLGEMSNEEREVFVEKIYSAIDTSGAKTLTDLNTDRKKLVKAWDGLDSGAKGTALKYFKLVFSEAAKSIISKK